MSTSKNIQSLIESGSWIRKMFERSEESKRRHGTHEICDLSLGNPIEEPPSEFFNALNAVSQQHAKGMHRYMPNAGYPEVRGAVAEWIQSNGIYDDVTENHIIMTCGAGGALNIILKSILNPGDEVIILAPYFVEYIYYIQNHGGEAVISQTTENFDLDIADIERKISKKTKALIICSPNNPCGKVYSSEKLSQLMRLLESKEEEFGDAIYLVSDEPYRDIVFDGIQLPNFHKEYNNSIFVYSWSKSLGIPGDRVGIVTINPKAREAHSLFTACTFSNRILGFINASATMQWVIKDIIGNAIPSVLYQKKRDVLYQALLDIGFNVVKPEGSFYMFPQSPLTDDSKLCEIAMEELLFVVPGSGFGRGGHFRIAFCVDDDVIDRSIGKFQKVFQNCSS